MVVASIVGTSSSASPRDGQGSMIVEAITARNSAPTAISSEIIGLLRSPHRGAGTEVTKSQAERAEALQLPPHRSAGAGGGPPCPSTAPVNRSHFALWSDLGGVATGSRAECSQPAGSRARRQRRGRQCAAIESPPGMMQRQCPDFGRLSVNSGRFVCSGPSNRARVTYTRLPTRASLPRNAATSVGRWNDCGCNGSKSGRVGCRGVK